MGTSQEHGLVQSWLSPAPLVTVFMVSIKNLIVSRFVLLVLALVFVSIEIPAAEFIATPGESLQALFDGADDGDYIHLPTGHYAGQIKINHTLHIRGESGTVIDVGGTSHGLIIAAPNVIIEGLEIINWGQNLTQQDAGILVMKTASGSVIKNNRLTGPGFGIWLDSVKAVQVLDNIVHGDPQLRSQDRGNGIHLFNVRNVLVRGNTVSHTRDGIYIDNSSHCLLKGNQLANLRYGIHYMYAYDNHIEGNVTRNTRTGYALMQSKRLTVIGNRSINDDNYGILMNNITGSLLRNNWVEHIRQPVNKQGEGRVSGGDGKAIFVYNSQFNQFLDNRFESSDIGIHLTAGSEDNVVAGNAFISNRQQVKYVATRPQEWSQEGRGNYWSNYMGWDMDADGIGDTAFEPNDAMDRLLWRYPAARPLMHSPSVLTLRWAQRQFPVFRPQGVKDSAPLMADPMSDQAGL